MPETKGFSGFFTFVPSNVLLYIAVNIAFYTIYSVFQGL